MVVKNCRECEHTNNCRSYYSGLGCKKRDEILKHIAELEAERKKVKQMIKIGLALIGVAVVVGLYSCVVAGKNTDNAMHDYFEKYK